MCKGSHSDVCDFFYELNNGFEDDWEQSAHARYLNCARALLGICSDMELVKKLVSTASNVDNM